MNGLKYCPHCRGNIREEIVDGRPVLVCERCQLAVYAWKDMSRQELLTRFNKRCEEAVTFSTTLEGFVRKEDGAELLRVLKDYQPCSVEEIMSRRSWPYSELRMNISQALDLELIRFVESSGHKEYMLTDLGKSIVREVVA